MDKTLNDRIKNVRSECEEYFYMGSAFIDDKEQAEKFAKVALKNHKLTMIAFLEAQIKLCNSGMNYSCDIHGFELGIRTANKGRKKTHEEQIAELRKDIELLELNIL